MASDSSPSSGATLPAQAPQHGTYDDEAPPRSGKAKATTPLPWRQLIVLCLMRLSEPISLTFIFPFISDFVWDLGTTKERGELGMYVGIVESLFAVIQTLTVLQWARASDKYGRKPILINGLLGSSISSLCLGLSTTFPMLVLARCLSGALNGNVAIYKATIGEMTDRTNAARAFSLLPLMWSAGCTIGPLLGGYLSRPAKRYPEWFSTKQDGLLALSGVWERHPYLLPCIVAASFSWFSVILGIVFLEETEPRKVAAKQMRAAQRLQGERRPLLSSESSPSRQYTTDDEAAAAAATNDRTHQYDQQATEPEPQERGQGVLSLLKIQHIRRIMLSYGFLALMSISLDAVHVLYFWELISIGGLSFPSTITGTMMSTAGVFGVLLQLCAFPYLQKRLGTLPLYRITVSGFLLVPLIMPMANIIARAGLQVPKEHQGGFMQDVSASARVIVLLLAGTAMAIKTASCMAFSCNIILVNQAAALAPGAQMGTLNGLAQMASSSMFAFGPYAASSLFALSLEKHLLGGYLIWFVLFVVAACGLAVTMGLLDIENLVDRGEIDEDAANRRG